MAKKLDFKAFIERRTKALATVFLTSRIDVHLFEISDESGLDFLVQVRPTQPWHMQAQFLGVIANGTLRKLATIDSASDHLNRLGSTEDDHPFSFPVIELIFSMEGDKGYFAWRYEPVLVEGGAPKLVRHSSLGCQPADRSALDEIVKRVDLWYQKLDALLLVGS